ASERRLQGAVAAQARVDFDQPMSASQQANEGIIQFVNRCMLDSLLGNPHVLSDWAKQIQVTHLDADGGQTGTSRKMLHWMYAILVHGEGPPISNLRLLDRYVPSPFLWQALFYQQHAAATL